MPTSPALQTPVTIAWFLRDVCKKPILSGLVLKWLTDRFVAEVQCFPQVHDRCCVHFVHNALAYVPCSAAPMVAATIRTVFVQPDAARS